MSEIWSQQEEADRLEARFDGVNQAKFARDHNIPGGKSMLNQHIKARRPMSMESAIVYAQALGVTLREISPRLALVLEGALEKGLIGGPKLDLQLEQIRLLIERAKKRDAAFLLATEALTRYLIQE